MSPSKSSEERDAIIDLLTTLDEQEKALSTDLLQYYVPHSNGPDGGQLAFHKSDAMIRLLITGNRFGKTTCAFIEAAWLATGLHPYHPMMVPNKGKVYAESFSVIGETIEQKIKDWLSADYLDQDKPIERDQRGNISQINFANGSFISVGSYDQEMSKAEGSDYDWYMFDEPPSRELFIACLRGLVDRGGKMWFSMTPLKEPWIFDDLWEPGLSGKKSYIACFRGSTHDNPNLSKAGIELFEEEMTEDEKDIRIHGNFRKLKGLTIDTYDPSRSDVDPFELNDSFQIYEGIDPHPSKPHTALWKAVHKTGIRFVCGEVSCAGSMKDFAREVSEKRRELCKGGSIIIRSVNDTSLNQTDPNFRINLRDEFCAGLRECGESLMPSNAQKKDWVLPGIQRIKDLYRNVDHENKEELLKYEWPDGIDFTKPSPTQYVFRNCTKYKYELRHNQWAKADDKDGKPRKKDDDFLDPDRYIESVAPSFETPGSKVIKRKGSVGYTRLSGAEKYINELLNKRVA